MAKNITILSVFVASPSDVSEERDCLEDVIRELNLMWSRTKGIQLELKRWETHAYPSVGESPQSVINSQLGDDYDIFIGILWKHFGTPTLQADSGTEEEFNQAYERYKRDPAKLRILFYFKVAPVEFNEIDPDQVNRIIQFKSKLGSKGTLYWEYRSKEEFMSFLRMHLTRHIEDWVKSWGDLALKTNSHSNGGQEFITSELETNKQLPKVVLEEEGYLDLLEFGTDNFESLRNQGLRLTETMQDFTTKITERSKELEKAQNISGEPDIKALKSICNHAAENLNQYSTVMESEVPLFAETFAKAIDAYAHASSLVLDFQSEDMQVKDALEQARSLIIELHATFTSVKESVSAFRESIARTPRMTTKYNQAKRRALAVVDSFISELSSGLHRLEETKKTIETLLNGTHN